jgi:2-hydroxychromene-2-carboxylate isomerase
VRSTWCRAPPPTSIPRRRCARLHAIRDAHELAARWDVEFPGKKPLEPGVLKRAHQVLIKARPDGEQLAVRWPSPRRCGPTIRRSWSRSWAATARGSDVGRAVPGDRLRSLRQAGFYQGGAFAYRGEWYLGVERLPYLEARLAADTGATPSRPLLERRPAGPPHKLALPAGAPTLELWFSFRSPYSYLAIAQIGAIVADLDVDLRLRPVLPLVERGAQMPRMKAMYIAKDAHREAQRLGIPFGHIADPLGAGARNAMAIMPAADAAGRGLAFAESAMRGVWAEALDLASYVDLRTIVERAGLGWDAARAALADATWQTAAADAAADLNAAGLWGVPSFRLGDYATLGPGSPAPPRRSRPRPPRGVSATPGGGSPTVTGMPIW